MKFYLPVILLLVSSVIAPHHLDNRGDAEMSPQSAPVKDAPVAQGEVGKKLDEYLSGIEKRGFSGTALVAKGGQIVLRKGYGLADKEKQIPNTTKTVICVGSITKQFTGAAILKLEMMGKLKVTDPITKFFQNVPADKQPITLHHLLTHTAGFPHDVGKGDYEVITREDYLLKALQSKLLFEPGAKHDYSNAVYSLLGVVIEKVTGQSYEQFLHDHLFKPAGMEQTGYAIPKWEAARVAVGYRGGKAWGRPTEKPWDKDGPYWNLRANGGILSTIDDMYRWHQALEGDKVLNAEAKRKLFTPHVKESEAGKSYYGYGWVIETTRRNTRLIWHNGGNGYFFADFWRFPQDQVVIYWATNEFDKAGVGVTGRLVQIALGLE